MVDLASLPWPCAGDDRSCRQGTGAQTQRAGARVEVPEGKVKVSSVCIEPNSTGAAHLAMIASFKRPPQGQVAFSAAGSMSGRALLAKDSADCDPSPAADWADINGGVATRDRAKGAVGALLTGLGGATKEAENGLVLVDQVAWQKLYDQRTKSLKCGGANSRIHKDYDGAWQASPSDPAPRKEEEWSETLRGSRHGELKTLYGVGSARAEEHLHCPTSQQTMATEVDVYDELCQLYGKQSQTGKAGNLVSAHQPVLQKTKLSPESPKVADKIRFNLGEKAPTCLCGPGRRRLEVLSQEQRSLRRCVSAQRVALKQAQHAMSMPSRSGTNGSRSRPPRAQSARRSMPTRPITTQPSRQDQPAGCPANQFPYDHIRSLTKS
jgi:hypothetical protein